MTGQNVSQKETGRGTSTSAVPRQIIAHVGDPGLGVAELARGVYENKGLMNLGGVSDGQLSQLPAEGERKKCTGVIFSSGERNRHSSSFPRRVVGGAREASEKRRRNPPQSLLQGKKKGSGNDAAESDTDGPVPKLIHMVWLSNDGKFPLDRVPHVVGFAERNPSWHLIVWVNRLPAAEMVDAVDARIRKGMKDRGTKRGAENANNVPNVTFHLLDSDSTAGFYNMDIICSTRDLAAKGDFLRVEMAHKWGGIYLDFDMFPAGAMPEDGGFDAYVGHVEETKPAGVAATAASQQSRERKVSLFRYPWLTSANPRRCDETSGFYVDDPQHRRCGGGRRQRRKRWRREVEVRGFGKADLAFFHERWRGLRPAQSLV